MKTTLAAALLAAVVAGPALGAETGGCGKFKWPIEGEIALLAKAEPASSGATLDAASPKGVRLALVDLDKAGFEIQPTKRLSPETRAGVLRFEAKAGLYQFTTTDRLWIDVVQDGKATEEGAFSGVTDCEGARKSVRFRLKDGPALLQISGPIAETSVTVTPVSE